MTGEVTAADFERAHDRLVADSRYQFEMDAYQPPDLSWLQGLGKLIEALGPVMQVLFWGGLALGVLVILVLIARALMRARWTGWRRKPAKAPDEAPATWRPDAQFARNLLAEADTLAAEGRYAEAAHILLLRSIEDIARRRPGDVRRDLTTREIGALSALPDAGRSLFLRIGRVVERSLFGGRDVSSDEFADCRASYEAFAKSGSWS